MGHFVAQVFTHAADLTVKPLGENDSESGFVYLVNKTGLGDGAEDRYALAHALQKTCIDGFVNRHDVLFFVLIARAEDFIDNISVVGKKNKSLRWFVQSTNRKEPLRVIDEIDNIFRFSGVGGTDDSYGLVKGQIQRRWLGFERLAFEEYLVSRKYPVSLLGNGAIDLYQTFLNKAICFTTRTDTRTTDVLVEAYRVVVGFIQKKKFWCERKVRDFLALVFVPMPRNSWLCSLAFAVVLFR